MSNRNLDVVAAGHLCLDIIPGFKSGRTYKPEEVFSPGNLVEVSGVTFAGGGPVANTGIGLVKQGMKVSFIAKVGEDEIGQLTRNWLKDWGSVDGVKFIKGEASSFTVVLAPPGIDRIFFHDPGTNNTFVAADIDYDLCGQARLFHLGYPPLMRSLFINDGAELVDIYRRVKEQGTTTSLDMAVPDPASEAGQVDWIKIFKQLLPYVDIFHPSAVEALYMAQPEKWRKMRNENPVGDLLDYFRDEDFTELSDLFLGWGASILTIKAGHRGFYLRTGKSEQFTSFGSAPPKDKSTWADRELWMPAYKMDNIASAAGSGDSSLAGFLTAYLKGLPPERCVAAGNSTGFQNLHELDATSGMSTWEATVGIMDDQERPRYEPIKMEGWRFDRELQLAYGKHDAKA